MKHIHIVNPYGSAAMLRLSGPLIDELPKLYSVTTSAEVEEADCNIHIPFHTLAGEKYSSGKHIAVYTHCNPGAERELYTACARADSIVAMSFTGRRELLNFGVDPRKIWVIPCAADGFNYRPQRVLIVGYPQPNGRKRESILLDLAFQYDLSIYEFVLAGGGWEQTASKLASLGVNVKIAQPVDDSVLSGFYQSADVVLMTGYIEGGPLPLLEAMASGTNVLSPRFGYAADYLSDEEIYTDAADLMNKLSALTANGIFNHQIARAWSWNDYAAEYALIMGRLLGESVDLYPERGMSRYAQLLDIVDEIHPRYLCEIGTWNGNRAIQLLQQASKYHPMKQLYYQGFDLFEGQTGEQFTRELSKVGQPLEVVRKRISATGAKLELVQGETFDTLNSRIHLQSELIFVDGGHSEATIENDGRVAMELLDYKKKAVVIFDDYYHEGQPDGIGCNKFIDALDLRKFEVTHLPTRTQASDGRLIGMVQVKRADIRLQMSEKTHSADYAWVYTAGNPPALREM